MLFLLPNSQTNPEYSYAQNLDITDVYHVRVAYENKTPMRTARENLPHASSEQAKK